jgi:hypothetical protein
MIPRPPKPMKGSNTATNDAASVAPGYGEPDMDDMAGKEPAEQAGYMELEGAQKDADCSIVEVEGGVSSDKGCSNLFQPVEGATVFSCGTCVFVTPPKDQQGMDSDKVTSDNQNEPGKVSNRDAVSNYGEL